MRIIHIITRLISGGADENTLLTCNAFAAEGHEVCLVYGRENDPEFLDKLDPRVRRVMMPSLTRNFAPLADIQSLVAVGRLFADFRPDVIHTHTSKAGFVGRLASVVAPDAVVVHGIHILPFIGVARPARIFYGVLEKIAARFTDVFISVSDGMRTKAIEFGLGAPDQHLVAPSGMEIHRYKKLRERNIEAVPSPLRVIYLANYEPRKGHAPLLEAIGRARTELQGRVFFQFAGRGNGREALQRYVADHGLEALVDVGSFCADPVSLMGGADVGIYCSSNEGLPRAIVQYCAAGLPVVAMTLPGIDSIVVDGSNGRLIAQRDFDGLIRSVLGLAREHETRKAMRRAASRVDLSAWSVESMCKSIHEGYVLATSRARRNMGIKRPKLVPSSVKDHGTG
jgi:glycosyltransferase involved in cell wall biosynthesis